MRLACGVILLTLCLTSTGVVGRQQACPIRDGTGHKVSRLDTAQGSVVFNANIRLGITPFGSLNIFAPPGLLPPTLPQGNDGNAWIGMQYLPFTSGGFVVDSTSPGCPCEGFGVSAAFGGPIELEGWHTQNLGQSGNLINQQVTSAGSNLTAVAQVDVVDPSQSDARALHISHSFRPSPATPLLYELNVTIENTGDDDVTELHYVRAMDWDIFPTTFDECVDIVLGTTSAPGGDVECAHTNGFIAPQASDFAAQYDDAVGVPVLLGRCANDLRTTLEKHGPEDHGSAWDFKFHEITPATPLKKGDKKSFLIFYGAAENDAQANGVLAAAQIEAYSFGYANEDGQCNRTGLRYIFGFGGLGGEVIVPSCGDGDCLVKNLQPSCGDGAVDASTDKRCITLSFDGTETCA